MKIMTNKKYKLICKILKDQNDKIVELKKENAELKRVIDKSMIRSMYGFEASDIDFPNSSKGGMFSLLSDDKLI